MSNLEWAAGSVIIPASEVANLKRVFRKRYNALIEIAYDEAKRFRAANTTSSMAKWVMAIENANAKIEKGDLAKHLALTVARSMPSPRAIKWETFEEAGLGRIGVGAVELPLFSQTGERIGKITFNSRRFSWEIFEGNHSVDTFHDSADAEFLYDVLKQIPWVKGTGGGESYYSEANGQIITSHTFGVLKRQYQHNYPETYTLPARY